MNTLDNTSQSSQAKELFIKQVGNWLANQDTSYLVNCATNNINMIDQIRKTFSPVAINFARGYIGSDGMDVLNNMGEDDFDDLVNYLLAINEDNGEAVFNHRDYFFGMTMMARDMFVGR